MRRVVFREQRLNRIDLVFSKKIIKRFEIMRRSISIEIFNEKRH